MNRIYKSIYNAARRCVVCVSEATGSAQGRKGNHVLSDLKTTRRIFKKTVVALSLGCAFFFNSIAYATSETEIAIGRVIYDIDENGQYSPVSTRSYWTDSFSYTWNGVASPKEVSILNMIATDKTLYSSFGSSYTNLQINLTIGEKATLNIVGGSNKEIYAINYLTHSGDGQIVNHGNLTIRGGSGVDANGVKFGSFSSSNIVLNNVGKGVLTIEGGSGLRAYGIGYLAFDESSGEINNIGQGTIVIQGGSGGGGIAELTAVSNSTAKLTNQSTGTVIIQGNSNYPGIGTSSNTDCTALISNDNSGKLIISGSESGTGSGIGSNTYDGTGTIANTGDGELIIKGGSYYSANGLRWNAYYGGTGIIKNTGSGTLTILGGSGKYAYGIEKNTERDDSTGTISNEGSGDLIISGGSGAVGLGSNSYGGTGIIQNISSGNLIIKGDAFSGISQNAYSGSGTITNSGSGSLTIQGGTSSKAYGIGSIAYDEGTGKVSNTGNGTLTIQAGTALETYGISIVANTSGFGSISNGAKGTLNIFGNTDLGVFGIRALADERGEQSLIENAGVMNLNKYAIGQFVEDNSNNDSVSVINKSTGIVNAEAEAIFEQAEYIVDVVVKPIPITIYTPEEGTKTASLDSYVDEQEITDERWTLKEDWDKYSTWEDGGKLVITDVVAGTEQANQITEAFQDRFGTGTELTFTGVAENSLNLVRDSESPIFTKEHVNELVEKGDVKFGSIITSEVLMAGMDLGGILISGHTVIGNSGVEDQIGEVIFSQDIGFKGINSINAVPLVPVFVCVKDGYSLTLVGEQVSMTTATRANNATPTFLLSGDAVQVEKDSSLKLGIAELSATQGYFEDLSLNDKTATLSVENGIFQITNVTGNGQINVQEKGRLTIANQAQAGAVTNKGVFNASGAETQIGVGAVSTMAEGSNRFDSFVNEKGAEATFADLTVAEGADLKNKAEATVNAGSVVLDGGAVITNFADGTLNFDSFEMNGTLRNNGTINVGGEMSLAEGTTTTLAGKVTAGTFSIGRAAQKAQAASVATMTDPQTVAEITGETYSDVLDLAGGDVFVRKDAILTGIDLKDNIVNSHVTVDVDGTFAFSFNENQLESALKDLKLDTEGKALAVLSTDLSFGETGSLTIGTTDATDTVNLGSDALVLLATDSLHGNAVLNGEGKETLNIKEGAELAFTDNAIWGNHYLVRDFVSMDAAENLTVKDLEGNVLETHYNDKGIYVTIGSTNILDKDAAFGLSNNINAIMDGQQNTLSALADIRYLSMAMSAKDGVKQTNDLQHLSAQAGVLSEAYRLTDNAHESIIRHAMSDKYSNVWVEALAGKGGVDGAGTGYGDASYDSDSYGMIFGLDGRIGQSINVGAAIHYQKGDLEADSSQTKNEFKNYGASIYAGTNFGNLNVTAGLTYAKGDHEFNQVNLGYVEGDTDTEVFMGGIRASYPIMVDRILITPYAGIEAVHVKEDGFKATIGGAHAFDFGSVSETFGRVPMGVKLSGGNAKFAGYADISVIPQFGNRDAKQSVSGVNTKATDVAKFDYADSVLGRVKMGAAYQVNKSTTLGVSYGASMGDVRDLSHEFSLNAKYRF